MVEFELFHYRPVVSPLRRAQTFLRMLDIDIAFGREGRSGRRTIRLSALGLSRPRADRMDCEEGQKTGIA